MGNRVSIKSHVTKEIDRLNELVNSSTPEPRKVLSLDQLSKMQQMREQEIDLHHIGILFVLDKGLKGYFDERDFMGLAETCLKHFERWKEQNFQQQLQAYCTLQMWHVVCGSGGDEVFAKWFCALLEESSRYQEKFEQVKRKKEREMGFEVYESSSEESDDEDLNKKKKKGRRNCSYVSVSSVYVLHKLLMLEELYGMSKTAFVSLCLDAAEEKKYPSKQVEQFFGFFFILLCVNCFG
jgi:hypothetical protein